MQTLADYYRAWMRGGSPITVPEGGVRMLENSTEVVLHRLGEFQVELITLRRGCVVPAHVHPNVDTYEVILAAGAQAFAEVGRKRHTNRGVNVIVPILRGVSHSAQPGAGADVSLLSFQRWHGVAPSFITDDWIGRAWQ